MPVTANGTAFDLTGDRSHPAVALIHGLGLRRSMWRDYVPVLAQNRCVLAYDLLGHGESEKPPAEPTLRLFSNQLSDLLDELGIERCAIVGFSLGGMINRQFTMISPDRVESLVVLNSPHERSPQEQRAVEQRAALTAAGGPAATLDSTIERWFTPQYIASHPQAVNRVRDWILSNDPQIYAACRAVLATGVKDLVSARISIRKPALVATCENDRGSTPRMSHAIAAEFGRAELEIVPQLQHLGLLEKPEIFLDLIVKFLEHAE